MPTIDEDLIKDLMVRATADVHAPAAACTRIRRERRRSRRTRRALITTTATALTTAAAAIAVASVASAPTTSHARPAAGASSSVPMTTTGRRGGTVKGSHQAASPLVRLAAYLKANEGRLPGNATLVARTTAGVTVYDLYTDGGQYYFSRTESGLAGQVSAHHNLAGGLFAREVAAAKLAATGNVRTAAQHMADAPDPSHVISPTQKTNAAAIAAKEKATGQKQGGNLFDNWVWENSEDAIIAGSGQPQVRAGVLRLLATLPDVTVKPGTSGGQPTQVLTAGVAELGYGYTEQLTINAKTGIPVSFAGGAPGKSPTGTVTYQVSRVTLADVEAGKP